MIVHHFDGFDIPDYDFYNHKYAQTYYFNDSLFTVDQGGLRDPYYTDGYFYDKAFRRMNTGFGGRPMYMNQFAYNGKVSISFHWTPDDGFRTTPLIGNSEFFTICQAGGDGTGWTKVLSFAVRDGLVTAEPKGGLHGQLQAWGSFKSGSLVNFGGSDNTNGVKIDVTAADIVTVNTWYHVEIILQDIGGNYSFQFYLDGEEILAGTFSKCKGNTSDPVWCGPRWESYMYSGTAIDNYAIVSDVDTVQGAWRVSTTWPAYDYQTAWAIHKPSILSDSYHWSKINQHFNNSNSYIYSSSPGALDLFKFERPYPVGKVEAVGFDARCYPKKVAGTGSSQFKIMGQLTGEDLAEVGSFQATLPESSLWAYSDFVAASGRYQLDPYGNDWLEDDFIGDWLFGPQFEAGSELGISQLALLRLHRAGPGAAGYYVAF